MPDARLCDQLTLDDFLCFDFSGPPGVTVAPDDSRSNFFRYLGLSEQSNWHRTVYRKMKEEARAGMARLFANRQCLQTELVYDISIQPPYNVTQITEVAFQAELERIYETASNQTRGIYDLTRTNDPNSLWVIRWMLWRVIQSGKLSVGSPSCSGSEIGFSIPSSASSRPDDSSVASVHTPKTDTVSVTTTTSSSYEASDSEDWDEDRTVRRRKNTSPRPQALVPRSRFWEDVMGTP